MHEELQELMGEFVADCFDLVEEFERGLLALEKHPTDAALLVEPKRVAHTLKGTAGMFDCELIRKLAKASDMLLAGALHCEPPLAGEAFTALREAFDCIYTELRHLSRGGTPGIDADPTLLDRLARLAHPSS